jgi:hypothetical protein
MAAYAAPAGKMVVALVALTIWATLWLVPTLIDQISEWYQTKIACVEDTTSSKSDVIRSRNRCA